MSTGRDLRASIHQEVDARTVDESLAFARVFADAVRAAREENRRLGIPNVQVDDQGRITEALPDGTLRVITGR